MLRTYRVFQRCGDGKIPKYRQTHEWRQYDPLEQCRGKNGIEFYLIANDPNNKKIAPIRARMASNDLNLSGIKISGSIGHCHIGYGNPLRDATYSIHHHPNPFYQYPHDEFIFILHGDSIYCPDVIELLVLQDERTMKYLCNGMLMGKWRDNLKALRESANFEMAE